MHNSQPANINSGSHKKLDDNDSTVGKVLIGLYHFWMIIFGIIILILSICAYTSADTFSDSIVDFRVNWEQGAVIDILPSLDKWPEGYDDLITSKWAGTEDGCFCDGLVYDNLHWGECNRSKKSRERWCSDVNDRDSMPLAKFYSRRICAKRASTNFVTAERPTKQMGKVQCKDGYKLCGSGDIEHTLCVKEKDECPINDIKILQKGVPPQPGYKVLPLDDNMSIAFTTLSDKLPVVRLKVTEGQVCANPTEMTATEGRGIYYLYDSSKYGVCSTKLGGKLYDPRYEKIGEIREDRLYTDNGVYSVIKHLPKYPVRDSEKYSWNLYADRYNEWNTECDKQKESERVIMRDNINKSVNLPSAQYTAMIVCIIMAVVWTFFIEFLTFWAMCCCLAEIGMKRYFCYPISYIIKVIFLIIIIWLFLKLIWDVNNYETSIQQIQKSKCSNAFANEMFVEYGNSILSTEGLNITCLVLAAISLLLSIAFFFYEMSKKNPYNKNDT